MSQATWFDGVKAMVGKEYGRVNSWDPVNSPMARQWCEMMGIDNPSYYDSGYGESSPHGRLTVPPAMLQVWCMEGLHINNYAPGSTKENPYEVLKMIESHGYPAVVAVNSELEFDRYLSVGESIYYTTRLQDVGDEKTTALGTGFFVTLIMTYFSEKAGGDEKVGELLFRVFKFKPANAGAPKKAEDKPAGIPKIMRPAPGISDDTKFFWEGAKEGKLLIQRCKSCGTLRHPPGPSCPSCHSFEWDTLTSKGLGEIYSFVVMHYPEVPPFDYPNPIALIQLDEGTRIVGGLTDIDPKNIKIGMRVEVVFKVVETDQGDITLPLFKPVL